MFGKCIQYTIHWNKTQMLRKFPSNKINSTKNAFFFHSRAPTHHSFTFNLRFPYELKHMVRLFKTVCGIFHFRFRFIFIKVYIFVQQNPCILLNKNINFNKNGTESKMKIPHRVLETRPLWFSSYKNRKLKVSVIIPFKIKILPKPHRVLLSGVWFFSYNKKF